MESKAKAFGHPIHPMLIVFPLGLLVSAVIFDVLHLVTGSNFFSIVAYYNIIGGVIGGLIAAVFGLIDWIAIPGGTRAKAVGALHGLGNVLVTGLFFVSWLLRMGNVDFVPSTLALIFSFLGVAVGGLTAWLGGELVYRLSVAVDPGANLNAPNSLTTDAPMSVGRRSASGIPVTGEEDESRH